jgi:hypothetical protein
VGGCKEIPVGRKICTSPVDMAATRIQRGDDDWSSIPHICDVTITIRQYNACERILDCILIFPSKNSDTQVFRGRRDVRIGKQDIKKLPV